MTKINAWWLLEQSQKLYIKARTFVGFVIHNLIDDDCSYRASALTFTTLLAIVPLMSVSFSLLSSFSVFNAFSDDIQNFIFNNFIPAKGKLIQQHLLNFTQQVSKLSIWGVAFLFVTAVLVMYTIEQALNKIWKVRVQRHGTSAFLLYWAILSLTPVLMGLSIAASSYIISLPFISQKAHLQLSSFVRYTPTLLSFISFTFLYIVVPNCKVRIHHALMGALFASVCLEFAKQGFSWYLTTYHTYELLYGAFAIVPIFFLWVYWAWFIILLGAEIAYAMSATHNRRLGDTVAPFSHAINWLNYLWLKQLKGESASVDELIHSCSLAYEIKPETMIKHFLKVKLIMPVDDGEFILSRDLSRMSFNELQQQLPWKWTTSKNGTGPKEVNAKVQHLLEQASHSTRGLFDVKVSELFDR